MSSKAVAAMGRISGVAKAQGGEVAAETEANAAEAASETAAAAAISHLYGTVLTSFSQQSKHHGPMQPPLARTQEVSAAERGAASATSAAQDGAAPLKESDLAHSFISGLLMPDGVTVRKPAPLGMASGDPVGTHIFKKKTTCLRSEKFSPCGSSGLNLSIHRRAAHSLSWQQRSFRSTAAAAAPATGAAKGKSTRGIFGRHLDLLESFPKLVAFSPSLSKALERKSSLYPAPHRPCSSISHPATECLFAAPAAGAVAAAGVFSSNEKERQQELKRHYSSVEQVSSTASAAPTAATACESLAADAVAAAAGSTASSEGKVGECIDTDSFVRSSCSCQAPASSAADVDATDAHSPPLLFSKSSDAAAAVAVAATPSARAVTKFEGFAAAETSARRATAETTILTSATHTTEKVAPEKSALFSSSSEGTSTDAATVSRASPVVLPQSKQEEQEERQMQLQEAPTQDDAGMERESLQQEILSCKEQLKHHPTNQEKVLYTLGILLFRCGRAREAIDIIADFLLRDAAASKIRRSVTLENGSGTGSSGKSGSASSGLSGFASGPGVVRESATTETETANGLRKECTAASAAAEDGAAAESPRATTATKEEGGEGAVVAMERKAAARGVEQAVRSQREDDANVREPVDVRSPANSSVAAARLTGSTAAAVAEEGSLQAIEKMVGVSESKGHVCDAVNVSTTELGVSHAPAADFGAAAGSCVKQQEAARAAEETAAQQFKKERGTEIGTAQVQQQQEGPQQLSVQQLHTRTKSEPQCQQQQYQEQPHVLVKLQRQQKVEEVQQKGRGAQQKPQKGMRGGRQEHADQQPGRPQSEETAKAPSILGNTAKYASAAVPPLTEKKEEATLSTAKLSTSVGETCLEGSATKHTVTADTGLARQLVPVEQLSGIVLDKKEQIERRARDLLDGWGLPRHHELEKLLGHLSFEEEDYMEAIRHYWRCIDICADDAQLFTNLGLTYYEVGSVKEATAAFEEAVKRDDRNVMALSTLSMLLMDDFLEKEEERRQEMEQEEGMEEDETKKAVEEIQRLRRLREGTMRCVLMLKRCLEIEQDNILVQLHLAQVFMCREEWTECEQIFHALLLENPNDTHLLNNLGQIAFSKGETETALSFFERVLRIHPEDELGHLHMCEVFCKLNNPARALQHFRLCCEASPDSVSLHATCGLPLCEIGKEKEIVAAYTNFIKKFPKSVAAQTFKRSLGLESENVSFSESSSIIMFTVLPIILLIVFLLGFAQFISFWTSPEESAASAWEESFYARYPSLAKKLD